MMEKEEPEEYMEYMKETYGFSYEQARAIRYASANDYSRQERAKREARLKDLQKRIGTYKRWIEENRKQ